MDIIGVIASLITIVLFLWGICMWFFSRKKTAPPPLGPIMRNPPPRTQSDNIYDSALEQDSLDAGNVSEQGNVAVGDVSGQGNVTVGNAKNINIQQSNSLTQLTPKQFKRIIELERNDAVEEYKKASTDEKVKLLRKISELDRRLTDLPQAFQEAQERIASLETALEREGNEIGAENLAKAKTALENGDFSKADELFAEIQTREDLAVQRSSRAALARGKIAEQEIRWTDAFKHYVRAAQLDPSFNTLIRAQKLAMDICDYPSALSLGKEAKKVAITEYGKNSLEHAVILNNLAGFYQEQGKYKKAEPIYKESLEINKKIFGEIHPETATSASNLAAVYQEQERYDEAEVLYKKSLEILKKTLGEYHAYTASIINNLAGLYHAQKLHEKAEPLYQQALKISKKVLGIKHPYTANSINNLGGIYQEQGKHDKAKPLFEQSLKIYQETLGENHPDTANSIYNLSTLYYRIGKYKKAVLFCKQALGIFESTLDPDHPKLKLVKHNYEVFKERLANAENDEPQ